VIKFRTERRTRMVSHTIDGHTNQVPQSYTVRTPQVPADWDVIGLRFASALVMGLTVAAIVWSTYSIGSLLHGGIGFAAAIVFDAAWLVNIVLEWLARNDPPKRAFSKRLGWALLVCTMGAIFWHGMLGGGSSGVALGVVGAFVSLFAKVLWMGIMRFVDRDLSEADAAWVAAEVSKANAQLAVASVRRQVARSEQRAAAELLAAEQIRSQISELMPNQAVRTIAVQASANTEQPIDVIDDEPEAEPERPNTVPVSGANTDRELVRTGPSIADLARQHLSQGASNPEVVASILRRVPTANKDSVAATVRRERKNLQGTQGYL
jgi:hypothetical protein